MLSRVIAKNVADVFLRHSVVQDTLEQRLISCSKQVTNRSHIFSAISVSFASSWVVYVYQFLFVGLCFVHVFFIYAFCIFCRLLRALSPVQLQSTACGELSV